MTDVQVLLFTYSQEEEMWESITANGRYAPLPQFSCPGDFS